MTTKPLTPLTPLTRKVVELIDQYGEVEAMQKLRAMVDENNQPIYTEQVLMFVIDELSALWV